MANQELKAAIGDNVRRLRLSSGLTQERLAELAGRDSSAITHIELRDRLIGVELLVRLADIFSVSVDSLVRPEGNAAHLTSIVSMLNGQSDEALAHLEPIVRAWLCEYGDPKPPGKESPQILDSSSAPRQNRKKRNKRK